ncbi:uncharacterized protein LOC118439195 isoform X1 [Folsomia candida]|uniref:uncharacterized protein LOC118439195 isoform X1 n=1 Tax=Folsomia candida TaxID=158441 RepID=UPI0016052EE0|nr:uncharacterized protein LOC118439195 isoform X1 [Folsomia candida]XP_035716187.1 uncharacterized protein LOC118439195 isoform X1 [Folsomia candida]XP_035716188.1 uncharacterized protein LOC118439195 isoform X1 [Folsomia candida]
MDSSRSTRYRRKRKLVENILHNIRHPVPNLLLTLPINYNLSSSTENHSSSPDSVAQYLPGLNDFQGDSLESTNLDNSSQIVSSSDDSDEGVSDIESESLCEAFRDWSLNHNITHIATKDLLSIINEKCGVTIPRDSRTLLGTPTSTKIREMGQGQFHYFGIKSILQKCISSGCISESDLSISLGIDGLPISKSGRSQFWPIICKIHQSKCNNLGIVALYFGQTKPASCAEYLKDLCSELNSFQAGTQFLGKLFKIKIHAIIADAPARAFIKQCSPYNAYYGCERCEQKGKWLGKVVFPEQNAVLRTDEDFKLRSRHEHHQGISPLADLNFGLVSQIPIDYMHLVCLGVVKRLLHMWVKGPLPYKLHNNLISKISCNLERYIAYAPTDFSRKPRCIREVDHYKATEFRQFLIYTGPVCLFNILPLNKYNHFLLLHVAIRILLSNSAQDISWNKYADQLLRMFVFQYPSLYSKDLVTYNVHSLIHLSNDAIKFGKLDNISAFPFENEMQYIKRTLRSKRHPMQQMINRIHERQNIHKSKIPVIYKGPGFSLKSSSVVTCKKGNNVVLLNSGECVLINYINNDICEGFKFKTVKSLYDHPCQSQNVHMYLCADIDTNKIQFKNSCVKSKCYMIPHLELDTFVCVALL